MWGDRQLIPHVCISKSVQWGTRWRSWLRHCATNRKVGVRFPIWVTGIIHRLNVCRPHYGPGVDTTSHRNNYQEYLLCRLSTNSGNLNCLEPWGSVQVCNVISLIFTSRQNIEMKQNSKYNSKCALLHLCHTFPRTFPLVRYNAASDEQVFRTRRCRILGALLETIFP